LIKRMVGGKVDDFYQGCTQALAGSAGGEVVGVAGDVEGSQAVATGEREEQARGALGEASAARGREDVVADVAVVEAHVVCV
jgi:hypothetical protein